MEREKRLIEELVKLHSKSKYSYQLKNYLKSKGIPPEDMDNLINESRKIYISESGKKRRVFWVIGAVLTFAIFYNFIPNSFYNLSPMLVSFIGAGILMFFVMQAIADFRSLDELNTKDESKQDWRHRLTPFLVIPGIIFVVIFSMNFSSKEKTELKEFGIKTKGVIVNGTSLKSRRGGTYQVTVKFKTKSGKTLYVNESVGEDEFNNVYKGQKVELYYSSKDPEMIELLLTDHTIKEYTESLEKNLNFEDLVALLDLDEGSIESHLNKMKYGWQYHKKDSLWVNERSNNALKIIPNKELRFVSYNTEFLSLPKKLKEQGYVEIESDEKDVNLLISEDYTIMTKKELSEMRLSYLIFINKNKQPETAEAIKE